MKIDCRDRERTLINIEDIVSCHYKNTTGEVIAKLAGEIILVDPTEGLPFEIESREVLVVDSPIQNFKEITTSQGLQDLFKAREAEHKATKKKKKKVTKKKSVGKTIKIPK